MSGASSRCARTCGGIASRSTARSVERRRAGRRSPQLAARPGGIATVVGLAELTEVSMTHAAHILVECTRTVFRRRRLRVRATPLRATRRRPRRRLSLERARVASGRPRAPHEAWCRNGPAAAAPPTRSPPACYSRNALSLTSPSGGPVQNSPTGRRRRRRRSASLPTTDAAARDCRVRRRGPRGEPRRRAGRARVDVAVRADPLRATTDLATTRATGAGARGLGPHLRARPARRRHAPRGDAVHIDVTPAGSRRRTRKSCIC